MRILNVVIFAVTMISIECTTASCLTLLEVFFYLTLVFLLHLTLTCSVEQDRTVAEHLLIPVFLTI